MKTPDHFDGPFTLVTHTVGRSQIGEWGCDAISLLRSADKDQDGVAPFSMMNQVLSCVAILRCDRLRLPVQKFPADGIISIHGTW